MVPGEIDHGAAFYSLRRSLLDMGCPFSQVPFKYKTAVSFQREGGIMYEELGIDYN